MSDRIMPVFTKCPHCNAKVKQSNLEMHIASRCEVAKNARMGLEPKATKNQRRIALEKLRIEKEALIKNKMFMLLTNVDSSHRRALVNELFQASNGNESNAIKRAKAHNQALEVTPFYLDDAHRLAANIRKGSLETRLAKAKELLDKHNGNYRKAFYDIDSLKIEAITKPKTIIEEKKPAKAKEITPPQAYFNKEVYQIAIRSMSNAEAWKLAHNENDAQAFLTAHRANYALLDRAVPAYTIEAPVEPPVKPERVLEPVSIPVRGEKVEISTIARDPAAQAAFRKAVTRNYNHCCAITGDTIAIEAAHIQTHSDHYDNSLDNGILLCVGLHRLFDAGIMVIDAELMTIHFKQDCFYKKHLEGAPVRQGRVAINKEKLKAKNLC